VAAPATAYEKIQQHSALTRWLHSRRYAHMVDLMGRLRREIPDRPIRIAEIGCAVAKLYAELDARFPIEYVGLDHDPTFCRVAEERYGRRPNFRVLCQSADDPATYREMGRPDLVCALETLEHIPEPMTMRIIERIAALKPRCFVASVPCEVGPALWIKNVGSLLVGYERHKQRPWREVFWAGLYQMNRLPPHRTGHGGFDWRWLAQTIRHFMHVRELRKSPVPFLPAAFAFSVMFVAEPYPEIPPAPGA
jgi:hypothetical protein